MRLFILMLLAAGCGAGVSPTQRAERHGLRTAEAPEAIRLTGAEVWTGEATTDSDSPNGAERRIKRFESVPPTDRPAPTYEQPLVPREQTRAIVLMYHSIDVSKKLSTVWPWDFEAHIERLRKDHIEIIPMSHLIDFLHGDIAQLPQRVAVITIDDGEVLFHKYAWPILEKHHVPFTVAIITKPTQLAAHAHALSWDQLNEMLSSGLCEIASHGHMHLALTGLRGAALDFELEHSRALIEAHTGFVPQAFMYPLGAFNSDVIERVRSAGYRAAFGAVGGAVHASSSPYRVHRFKMQRTTAHNAFARFFERVEPSR